METYVVALDQGTTSSRAILFNRAGEIVSRAQHPFRQIYPQPGWVEHDPLDIWATEKRALAEAVDAGLSVRGGKDKFVLYHGKTFLSVLYCLPSGIGCLLYGLMIPHVRPKCQRRS